MHGRWEKSCAPLVAPPPLLAAPGLGAPCPAPAVGQPSWLQLTPEQCLLAARVRSSWVWTGLALKLLPGPGTAPLGWQMPCAPSHLSFLHPRRAQLCLMEVRLFFALGREASTVFRGGGSPQSAWCQGQGASREPGPVSAQAVLWAGAWPGPHSAGLSPLPGTPHIPPSLPHGPMSPVPPFWLLSWHPGVLRAERLPRASRTWVPASPRFPEGVCLSVCLSLCIGYLRWSIHPSRPCCRILPARGASGCSSHLHAQGVHSYPMFWTGEGRGAWQSSNLPPPLFLLALLGEPCLRTFTFSCK